MSGHEKYPDYAMILEWDPNDQIYVVTVPELPGCMTHGSTREEAVRQGQDALESWIDVAREDGAPMPPPHYFDLGPLNDPAEDVEDVVGAGRHRA